MGRLLGADADELALFGRRMEEAANRLDAIRHEVTAVVRQAQWEGDDAVQFRDQWQYRLSAMLQGAVTLTRNGSAVAIRNAEEQRTASATDSGPVGGAVPGPGGVGGQVGAAVGGAAVGGAVPGSGSGDPLADPSTALGIFGGVTGILGGFGAAVDKAGSGWLGRVGDGSVLRAANAVTESRWYGYADTLGKAAGYVGHAIDGFRLGTAIAGGDPDEIKARGVDAAVGVAFTAATLAATACPPALIALGVAQVGWSFVPDEFKVGVVDGVSDAAQDVAGVTSDVAGAVWGGATDAANAVQDVGDAVTGIASGGFDAAGDLLGW